MAKKSHRQYDNDFPSVTTVLAELRNIGLEMWFKYNTLQFTNAESAKGKLIGTQIHSAIENFIINNKLTVETEYEEEVVNALQSFVLFRKEHPEIELQMPELALTSLVHQFNGTIDIIGKQENVLLLGDWKSGKAKNKDKPDVYDSHIYQVSAYVHLYNEIKQADIKRAFIVVMAKDKFAYNLRWVEEEEIKESFEQVFLSALKILNYKKGKKYGDFWNKS
jgi:hypothetical protein